jgi:urease subunit alpha
MFGSFGGAVAASALTFVSAAAHGAGIGRQLGIAKTTAAVANTRGGISKRSMKLNDLLPVMEVDPETYEVRANGRLLTCEPAQQLAMAQRYFLF